MKKHVVLLLVMSVLVSCESDNSAFMSAPVTNSPKEMSYSSLDIEKIVLDSVNNSSFGESFITNDGMIAFVDKHFCTLSKFKPSGEYVQTFLGYGKGPGEVQVGRVAGQTYMEDGRLMLFGYNLDFHIVNSDLKSKEMFVLNRNSNELIDKSSLTYTNQYNDMVCRSYKDNVYFNIYSEHPEFNYLEHMDEYLGKCRHIWEIDIKTQEDKRLLAPGYPSSYLNDRYKNVVFLGTCFDVDKHGNFYVKYDSDSLIYVYDNDFTPLMTYGYEGLNMDKNYLSIYNYKESRKNYRSERNGKGYYYWIEYVDETGLLFVSYRKKDESVDGLQIYKDGKMLADIEVPEKFRVMGYIEPYYYSYVIPNLDEEDDSMQIYRFKMK